MSDDRNEYRTAWTKVYLELAIKYLDAQKNEKTTFVALNRAATQATQTMVYRHWYWEQYGPQEQAASEQALRSGIEK